MSDKAEWAYRTISEVSEELDVPPHVLRFWETKFTQLKPMKRSGSRRYYKASDLELLIRIRDLLYRDGFTIKGAQKALREKKQAAIAPEQEAMSAPAPNQASDAGTHAQSADNAHIQSQASTSAEATSVPAQAAKNIADALARLKRLDARLDALMAKQ